MAIFWLWCYATVLQNVTYYWVNVGKMYKGTLCIIFTTTITLIFKKDMIDY